MKRVFIVDDNMVNLVTADEALSEKYDVLTMASASIMFGFLERTRPDLVLLDIMMPDMSGFDAVKRLKADARYNDIPVMFVTGENDESTETVSLEMGVVDFITKPFTGSELLDRVDRYFDQAGNQLCYKGD